MSFLHRVGRLPLEVFQVRPSGRRSRDRPRTRWPIWPGNTSRRRWQALLNLLSTATWPRLTGRRHYRKYTVYYKEVLWHCVCVMVHVLLYFSTVECKMVETKPQCVCVLDIIIIALLETIVAEHKTTSQSQNALSAAQSNQPMCVFMCVYVCVNTTQQAHTHDLGWPRRNLTGAREDVSKAEKDETKCGRTKEAFRHEHTWTYMCMNTCLTLI